MRLCGCLEFLHVFALSKPNVARVSSATAQTASTHIYRLFEAEGTFEGLSNGRDLPSYLRRVGSFESSLEGFLKVPLKVPFEGAFELSAEESEQGPSAALFEFFIED